MKPRAAKSPRAAREAALRAAYAVAVGGSVLDEALAPEVTGYLLDEENAAFARRMVEAVIGSTAELDERFQGFLASGWGVERQAVVDILILRLASHELWSEPDTPPRVVVSEAMRLAEEYGTAESAKFVQGVLAKVVLASPKADWKPAATARKSVKQRAAPTEKSPSRAKRAGWTVKTTAE